MLLIAACSPTTQKRGNYLYQDDMDMIQAGVSTKYDVLNILGTPTAKAVFDEGTWYYVGLVTEKESFFDEKVSDKKIYQIEFDADDVVVILSEVTKEGMDVPLASRVTPTSGNEVTFLQQILGNLGKFNPPSQ